MCIRERIIFPIWKILDKYSIREKFVYNINLDVCNAKQPRVLLSYITAGFEKEIPDRHTNIKESSVMIKYFIDRGYVVDVVNCTNKTNLDFRNDYDVVLGFGMPYAIACKQNPNAKKIAYLTETAPDVSLKNEMERVEYYFMRHGIRTYATRSGIYYKNSDLLLSDYGMLVGNAFTASAYRTTFPGMKIKVITPTGLYNNRFKFEEKSSREQCNFLWFGSSGVIHKGLDIVLDVFKDMQEVNLYVCGVSKNERWIFDDYKNCKNIFDCGFVDVCSEEYLSIIKNVAFIILPSAAEGMATSVLTCMRHGVIPIITRNTGITLENYGIYLEDYSIEYVSEMVRQASKYDLKRINKERQMIYSYANTEFKLETYKEKIYDVLDSIINKQFERV